MKYASWILGAIILIFGASCDLLNPTANQSTVEASNQSGSGCVVGVNLDGNNGVSIVTGGEYTFPLVSPGSHTLNFWTSGNDGASSNPCVFNNSGATGGGVSFSAPLTTTAGTLYVGTVGAAVSNGVTIDYQLVESTSP